MHICILYLCIYTQWQCCILQDQRLAERLVSFYYSENDVFQEDTFDSSFSKIKAHLIRAKMQKVEWSESAMTHLIDAYVKLRNTFSEVLLNGKRQSRITQNHLRYSVQHLTNTQVWYIIGIISVSSSPTHFHSFSKIFIFSRSVILVSECITKLLPKQNTTSLVSIVESEAVEEAYNIVLVKNSHFLNLNADLINPEVIIFIRKTIIDGTASLKTMPDLNNFLPSP